MIERIKESSKLRLNHKIDLIIKPTEICNFGCLFCSSNNITNEKNQILPLELLFDFLKNNNVGRIIVNGGDPLMMPPEYYYKLIDFLNKNEMETSISFTTNLWDFYINTEKWLDLFKEPRIYVATSFQYGGERRLKDGTIYTEELFTKVFNKFKELIGYNPLFISVLNKSNEDKVIETIKLARDLNTECKLNPAAASGRSRYFYPIYKAYEKYLDIIDAGLEKWEFNSKEIRKLIRNKQTICPFSKECHKYIRCLSPNGNLHSCGSFNDDHNVNEKLNKKTYELHKFDENEIKKDFKFIKKECLSCELFDFCNSCYKRIADIKNSNSENDHCSGMHRIKDRLLKTL